MPTALSVVGVAWTVPLIAFLLLGGVFTDRYDRRRLMIGADLIRAAAIGLLGVLSLAGVIELWHVVVLIAFVGLGDAFFNPAATAIVPDLLPGRAPAPGECAQRPDQAAHHPPHRSGTGRFRRRTLQRRAPRSSSTRPSFLVSAVAIAAISAPAARARSFRTASARPSPRSARAWHLPDGQPWLWATLLSAMFSLLCFIGPVQVLLPFLVKNQLALGPEALGAIFAVGGIGSVVSAIAIGQLGLPRRCVTVMYVAGRSASRCMAVYGLMTTLWQGTARRPPDRLVVRGRLRSSG